MYYVYIIYSKRFDRYYIGMSVDVKQRLITHNLGRVKSTKAFVRWELVHSENFNTSEEARIREKYLKSAAGRRWRKNNLGL